MWIDITFRGRIVSRTYYRIIPDVILPQGVTLNGFDDGIMMFITNRPYDEETITNIITKIAERHEQSINYMTIAVNWDLRREEYVPDALVLIDRGHRHIEGQDYSPIPTYNNNTDLLRNLFMSNKHRMTEAVGDLIEDVGVKVDLFNIDFRQEDDD